MKILVIEDDLKLSALLKRGLEKVGHVVETAHRADEGGIRAETPDYDAVILDVKLPDGDGIVLCAKLRKNGVKTPILVLTARDSVDDKVAGLAAGADDYLTKPFSLEELRARLQALMRRNPQYVETVVLRVRDLTLDASAAEVTVAGHRIPLTHKEFAVLELLMRNPNRVFTREQIFDRVWGEGSESVSNVVDAVIARSRSKLDAHTTGKSFITTIRGLGYKMEV